MNPRFGQSAFAMAGDCIALHELAAAGVTRNDDVLQGRE